MRMFGVGTVQRSLILGFARSDVAPDAHAHGSRGIPRFGWPSFARTSHFYGSAS